MERQLGSILKLNARECLIYSNNDVTFKKDMCYFMILKHILIVTIPLVLTVKWQVNSTA